MDFKLNMSEIVNNFVDDSILLTPEIIDRFIIKIDYPIDLEHSCWIWNKNTTKNGYGKFWIIHRDFLAHRVMYKLFYGIDPGDKLVCHECDNPLCVNPYHLFLGNIQDNMNDMKNKGRSLLGSKCKNSKLTEDSIKQLLTDIYNEKYDDIETYAYHYKISSINIRDILNGRTWTQISNNLPFTLKEIKSKIINRKDKSGRSLFKVDDIINIRQRLKNGEKMIDLAKEYKTTKVTICNIKNKKVWKHI